MVVVAANEYLDAVRDLVIVVPVTTVDRGWGHHVGLHGPIGLSRASFAMTEQPRTISRTRITRVVGQCDASTMREISLCLRDWLGL